MKNLNLYVYLTKRDKQGARILIKFLSRPQSPTRITDDNISKLFIPTNYLNLLKQKIYESRMLWEPWVETADTFESLKSILIKRGYTNLPLTDSPEIISDNSVLNNKLDNKLSMLRKL